VIGGYSPKRYCLFYWFRPYGGSLLAVAPKVSKRSCPMPAAVTPLRSVSSLHHCSVGTLRRAICGPTQLSALASCVALPPASMQSSRHSAAQPATQRLCYSLRSPFGPACGCYFATFRPAERGVVRARMDGFGRTASGFWLCRMGGAERYPCG
jgi:hypothetical protein